MPNDCAKMLFLLFLNFLNKKDQIIEDERDENLIIVSS